MRALWNFLTLLPFLFRLCRTENTESYRLTGGAFVGDQALGITGPQSSWQLDDFSPWWWLPTVESLKSICTVGGFRFHKGAHFWNDNTFVLLLS
jgi:hypothetical protein